METKNRITRPARSLAATIATAFLTLSAVILLTSGGFQLFFNVQAQQKAQANLQQNIAQVAADKVNNFIEQNFSVLSTSVWVAHPDTLPKANQSQFMLSLLVDQPA
jgi:hypothetical protein